MLVVAKKYLNNKTSDNNSNENLFNNNLGFRIFRRPLEWCRGMVLPRSSRESFLLQDTYRDLLRNGIFKYLSKRDIQNLARCSKKLREICHQCIRIIDCKKPEGSVSTETTLEQIIADAVRKNQKIEIIINQQSHITSLEKILSNYPEVWQSITEIDFSEIEIDSEQVASQIATFLSKCPNVEVLSFGNIACRQTIDLTQCPLQVLKTLSFKDIRGAIKLSTELGNLQKLTFLNIESRVVLDLSGCSLGNLQELYIGSIMIDATKQALGYIDGEVKLPNNIPTLQKLFLGYISSNARIDLSQHSFPHLVKFSVGMVNSRAVKLPLNLPNVRELSVGNGPLKDIATVAALTNLLQASYPNLSLRDQMRLRYGKFASQYDKAKQALYNKLKIVYQKLWNIYRAGANLPRETQLSVLVGLISLIFAIYQLQTGLRYLWEFSA